MPADGERLEFWQVSGTSDHVRVRHCIAIYHDYLSWEELAGLGIVRQGVPADHEWIVWSETDWRYDNGDRHHYWQWGRGDKDEAFKKWLKSYDGVPRTDIFYEYEPARKKAEEQIGRRLQSLQNDVQRTLAALTIVREAQVHDCLPLPAKEPV